MDPIGVHSFWRFSPALDYQQIHRTVFGGEGSTPEPLCILLVQPSDPTAIIKTISQRFRHSTRPLHFYVYERVPEALARHMLLLSIATDWELPIRQRAHLWLEVYGNALVQARTASYISARRALLMDVLCSGRGPAPLPTLMDAHTLLKHRARDEVEGVLKTWDSGIAYDVTLYRDTRIRSHLGARYDSRDNVADWDYNAVVKCGAGCIHGRQYREWRRSGVAYEYGEERYHHPNRTLGSYAEGKAKRRGSVMARGFWGDTVVSPFWAMGTTGFVPTDEEVRAGLDIAAAAAAAAEAATAAAAAAAAASGGGGDGSTKAPHSPSHPIPSPSTTVANFAASLFDVLNRRQGSEQWRHHAVELATYNLLAWLWEMESGRTYVMTRDNDIYSGLERVVVGSGGVKKGGEDGESVEEEKEGGEEEAAAAPGAGAAVSTATAPLTEGSSTTPTAEEVQPQPTLPQKQAAQQQSQKEPLPPPVLTPEEAEGVQKGMRAAALARAKTIARTFKNVTCTLIGGDFKADFLDKGDLSTNRLAGKIHVLALSTRSAHHLGHPHLDSLLHSGGASVVVETGRNIPDVLTGEQRGEMTRRILGMGAGDLGGVVCGSDRALSADTYAVGTVLGGGEEINNSSSSSNSGKAPSTPAAGSAAAAHRHFIPPRGGLPPSGPCTPYTSPLPLTSTAPPGSTDALPRPPTFGGRPPAFVNGVGAISSLGTPLSRPARVKAGGMAAFSHRMGPLPCLAAPPGQEAGYGKRAGREAFALAQGVASHPWEGGDNPAPEAIVFAWVEALAEHVKAGYKDASGEAEGRKKEGGKGGEEEEEKK